MEQYSLSKQIRTAREQRKLTQLELANKCNLNLRTIQRIENNETKPRLYTLRIIGEVLDIKLNTNNDNKVEQEQIVKFRRIFKERKQIRIFTFLAAIFLLAAALLLILSGIPKYTWAPFIYLLFFADLIVIGYTWRCPGCNSLLGDVFNTQYCSKCGLKFYKD